jgi:hypothetical protein
MPSLKPNLVKRIARLPKPTNTAAALQPLFEAISNSIHSTQAKFGGRVAARGRIVIDITQDRKKGEYVDYSGGQWPGPRRRQLQGVRNDRYR